MEIFIIHHAVTKILFFFCKKELFTPVVYSPYFDLIIVLRLLQNVFMFHYRVLSLSNRERDRITGKLGGNP